MSEKARAKIVRPRTPAQGFADYPSAKSNFAKPSSFVWWYLGFDHGACTARTGSQTLHARYVILQNQGGNRYPTGGRHTHHRRSGKRLFSSTTYIFILWMVGTSLVLFAVASIFMRNQVRPIRRLAQAADAFGKGGEMSQDFRIQGASEVRLAATAFNRMRERINRQIRQRTDMLSGVSHDLRTPLTRIKLQLAMVPESPEIEELKSDLSDMEKMIEGYLTFARGEGDEKGVEMSLSGIGYRSGRRLEAKWHRNRSACRGRNRSDLKTHRIWQMPEQPDRERQPIR